ncbi:MAG: transglycosylase SLT domain-containing protein [Bacteriovoracaceae bacterium]
MIFKYFLISLFVLIFITASDPFFGIDLSIRKIPKEKPGDVRELPWMSTHAFKPYILDHKDRVNDVFRVNSFYYPNVNFWFLIYTQFESSHVVIHDKNNLSLIYKVLDFSALHAKNLPKNTLYVLQRKISDERLDDLKSDLNFIKHNPFTLESRAKAIYRALDQARVKLPTHKNKWASFFSNLTSNLRTQTGQKNFIRNGVINSLPYQKFLSHYFEEKNLPRELLAIPFLESSFNPKAESKVNALGVWQFMPLISSYYVPKRTNQFDYRSNVGIASIAAAFLMSENIKIMKTWDLAVTAYNSGTKHLVKSKRELNKSNASLEEIIKHSNSQHFGFASKNFYSEFLALTHTLAYREDLFPGLHKHDRSDVDESLRFSMLKCSFRLDKFLDEEQLDDVIFHNHHIADIKKPFPRGFILTTKSNLPKSKFLSLSHEQIISTKPKDWMKFLANQSCSTR